MNIDAWHAALLWLVMVALAVVFYGFVPLAILAGQWLLPIVQIICIGTVVISIWRILTYRCFKLDHRIGLSFVAYILATALTNLVGWLLQQGLR